MDGKTVLLWIVGVVAVFGIGGTYGYYNDWFGGEEEPECAEGQVLDDAGNCVADTTGDTGSTPQVIVINPNAGQQPSQGYVPPQVQPSMGNEKKAVEDLRAKVKNKFTMADITTGNVSFYQPGADVSDPYVLSLDDVDLATANSASTDLIVQTGTVYDVYFVDKTGAFYDDKIGSWSINYNSDTGKGSLQFSGQSFWGASNVGTFVDVDTLPEVQTGVNDTGTDQVKYVENDLTGSMRIQLDLGNSESNSELRDVVVCFDDADGDMEGNEITAVTASYIQGSTALSLPGNLQTYWEDAMGGSGTQCMNAAALLGSSQRSRWEFVFTVDESLFDTGEEFEILQDDVGDHLEKSYPSRHAKATVETLTIGDA